MLWFRDNGGDERGSRAVECLLPRFPAVAARLGRRAPLRSQSAFTSSPTPWCRDPAELANRFSRIGWNGGTSVEGYVRSARTAGPASERVAASPSRRARTPTGSVQLCSTCPNGRSATVGTPIRSANSDITPTTG